MKCPECGCEIIKVDAVESNGEYYHIEDTEWLVNPTREDPGILVPRMGARPAICMHHEEFANEELKEKDLIKEKDLTKL